MNSASYNSWQIAICKGFVNFQWANGTSDILFIQQMLLRKTNGSCLTNMETSCQLYWDHPMYLSREGPVVCGESRSCLCPVQGSQRAGDHGPWKEVIWRTSITAWEVALRQRTSDFTHLRRYQVFRSRVYAIQKSAWCWLEGDSHLTHRGGIKLWLKWPWNKPPLDPGSVLNCVSLDCLHTTFHLSSLTCEIGLTMTWKAKMLIIVMNGHAVNLMTFQDILKWNWKQEWVEGPEGRLGRVQFLCPPLFGRNKRGMFDDGKA